MMIANLQQGLKKVATFFQPENLARQTIKYEGEVALLVIDVQKEYCDPAAGERGNAETDEVSKRIKSLVPEFRKAGVPVYAIYFSHEKRKAHEIDFHEFSPDPDDTLIRKNRDSAFAGSNIKDILRGDKRKKLLACGFNLSACVSRTIKDARENGFDVCLMRDLTANDNHNPDRNFYEAEFKDLEESGIAVQSSGQVLADLQARNKAPAAAAIQL